MKQFCSFVVLCAMTTLVGCTSECDSADESQYVEVQTQEESRSVMKIDTTDHFTVYYPEYSRVALACGTQPEENNDSIIYCAEAAFTASLDKGGIVGAYALAGQYVNGGVGDAYGCFAFYNGEFHFAFNPSSTLNKQVLRTAAANGGMGFT